MPTPYAWVPVAAADAQFLLADIAQLCKQSLDAARVTLRMRPLPFYELFDLYELTESPDIDPTAPGRRAYVLWSPGLLRLLGFKNDPIYKLNAELVKLGALHITETTAPEYLRFFWGMVKGVNGFFQILENAEVLVRPQTATESDDELTAAAQPERWYTAAAVCATPSATGGFEAALSISFQSNLFTAQAQIAAAGEMSLGSEQLIGEILTHVPPPDEQQPHEALPLDLTDEAQQRQAADLIRILRQLRTPAVSGFEWQDTDPATHQALIAAINSLCGESLRPELIRSRRTSLSFYELVNLYELERYGAEDATDQPPSHRAYVLWTQPTYMAEGANLLLPLNWTNGPLYDMAEELERVGQLKLNAETAPDYLRFFFNLVKGRHGFFRILEACTVEVRPENEPDYTEVIGRPVAQATPSATKAALNDFRVALHIEFNNSIFRANGYVTPNGQVRLADEALLGDLLTTIPPLAENQAAWPPLLWELRLRETQPTERQRILFKLGLQKLQEVAEKAPKEHGWEILSADEFLVQLKEKSRTGGTLRRKRVQDKRMLGTLAITADGLQGLPSYDPAPDTITLAGNTQELTGTDKINITDIDCPQGKIRLEDCYFEGALELNVVDSHALFEASRCFFKGDVVFGKDWAGSVVIKTSRFLVADASAPQLKMTDIDQAGSVELDAVWLASGLTFDRLHCSVLTISNSLLEGPASLERLHCESITVGKGSTVMGELKLGQLHCEAVKLNLGSRSAAEIDLTNAVVQGAVELTELSSGNLSGKNLRCETLTVTGLGRDEPSTLEYISLPELRATRVQIFAIRCQGACMLDAATIEFNLSIFDSHIANKLSLVNATLRNLTFTKLHVGQQCDLTSTAVERKLKITSWFGYDGDSGVFIGGHLLLDRVQAGHLDASGCTVDGNVSAADAQFASFNWWPGLERVPGEKLALRFKGSQVRGYVHLPGTIVAGDFNWVGVSVEGANTNNKLGGSTEKVAFEAGMLQVQGHFRLTSTVEELRKNVLDLYTGYTGIDEDKLDQQVQAAAAAMPDSEWQSSSTFTGAVSLQGLTLTGDADCSQSKVAGSLVLDFSQLGGSLTLGNTRIAGSLRLNRCRVQHNLELGQQTQIAQNGIMTALRVEGSLRFAGARFDHSLYLNDARLTQGLTTAEGLTVGGCLVLNAAQAQEDIDLTGLALGENPCQACKPLPHQYQFSATDLVVEGTLLFSPELLAGNSQHARIPGDINLSRAKLRRLVLFDEERFALSKQAALAEPFANVSEELNLEDADIGTLRVNQPPPRKLILRGLSVREWDFEKLTEQARSFISRGCELDLRLRKLEKDGVAEKARGYIIFLERAEVIPASLYRAVERRFYDEGDTETSDAIYKSLRDREIREISSDIVRGATRFFNGFFGYFVTWPAWWAWIIIGGLFGLSSFIFSQADWIIPHTTSALVGKYAIPLPIGGSHPTIWNFGNGVLLALRYHIPIIQAVSHPEWVPSDQPWRFIWPGRYWLSPESYASLVALISWIVVPVFILIISRNILRRAKQGS